MSDVECPFAVDLKAFLAELDLTDEACDLHLVCMQCHNDVGECRCLVKGKTICLCAWCISERFGGSLSLSLSTCGR